MAGIEVRLLGPVVSLVDGMPVEIPSGKQRALLARLALDAGERLSIDRLVDDLWGEQPPATARHALQVHVSSLRKTLGASTVGTERPGYVLRVPREACDATRFETLALAGRRSLEHGDAEHAAAALSEALSLWRGPALSDLLFEPFAPHAASRLEELRIATIEDRVVADLELGRHVEVAGELEGLVGEHPLRERLRGALMLALYRSGRQVAALRTYQEFRDRLRDELGLDPGPELRQLETAILRHDASLAAPRADRDRAPETRAAPASANGELPETRRAATVVVASLTGFDRAASALDPEDLRAMLDRSASTLASVIDRYGGTVESTTGGELIAVFGAPTAHEDDPERAVRAAHDLLIAVREDAELARLSVSVGVATGEVLFAASGPPEQRRFTVIGDVMNEARRLQARAPDDTVVVGSFTYGATHTTVAYEDLGNATYGVVGIPGTRRSRPLGLTPFLGRDSELESLLRTWDRTVAERRTHLVSILGEPGVGKSRLLAEFQRATDGRRVVSGRCIPYGEALSYAPLADALREAAGASSDDPPAVVRSRLRGLVKKAATLGDEAAEVERHVALLTGLDDEHDRAGGLADERTLHNSTRRFLEALARAEPLCIAIEDVHWADDALLDLFEAIARRTKGVPLMLVTFARPELVERRPGWGGGVAGFTSIPLDPLDASSTRSLVEELGRAHSIPDDVLERIAQRSSGNPLFAEELVATVAEGEESTGIPASLTSLLLARVDALPAPQQSALRNAAVVGMTFWPSAVQALQEAVATSGADGADIAETIADLESRDLVRVEPRAALGGEVAYSFKHVLIRDAAYESLTKGQRRELHRAADGWLSEAAGDRLGEFSDQLAHHALASGQPERALDYLTMAADRSRRAAAHRREAALLEQALQIAATLDRPDHVADLRARRGKALSRLTQWAEARAELEGALEGLADTAESEARRAEIHNDLAVAYFWLLDTASLRTHGDAALDLARRSGAREQELAARVQLASADSADGEVDLVLTGGRTLINDAQKWGIDPPYERLTVYGLQLYLTGDWQGAIEVSRRGAQTARAGGDTQFVLSHMSQEALSAAACARYDDAIAIFEAARRFGEEYEMIAGLPRCIAMSAVFRFDLFDFEGAEAVHEEARELGTMYFKPSEVSAGIDLLFNYTRRGEVERALPLVDAVGEEVVKGGGWHGWLWGLRFATLQAEIALAQSDHDRAIDLAHMAIEKARAKRRAKYEAFARTTLGRALVGTGRKQEGLEELRSAFAITDRLGHPAAHVLASANLLDIEPDESTAASGRAAIERVLDGLSDHALRERFLGSEPVRTIMALDRTTQAKP